MKTFKKGDYVWANVAACYVKGSGVPYTLHMKMPKILIPCKLLEDVMETIENEYNTLDYLIESTHLCDGKTYAYLGNIKSSMNPEEIFAYLMES